MSKLTIVANFIVKTDKIEQIKTEFLTLVKTTRAEDEGCISYDLFQDNTDLSKFTVIETWESDALLQKHADSTHFKSFMKTTESMVESFTINSLTQIA